MGIILLASLLLVGLAVLLMGVRVFFKRDGRFPSSHVGSNQAMRDRGIGCHTSQHREAQLHRNLAERVREQQNN
ncbi:hypothetical protein [Porphyromonas loveana]|uniref:hypothetical protein n=1 Tax=Porphyromonas loveana TaxID=1884669 RepID=UPI0035A0E398